MAKVWHYVTVHREVSVYQNADPENAMAIFSAGKAGFEDDVQALMQDDWDLAGGVAHSHHVHPNDKTTQGWREDAVWAQALVKKY